MPNDELKFAGRVLDNVHGFIYYTESEGIIIRTSLFKRLQSIKQLSIVNWVFPGSEHTRYIHSLGVMYIADKIAQQLNLSIRERKIVRMAGLLHDIGHYPLSHVCESPYQEGLEVYLDSSYSQVVLNKHISVTEWMAVQIVNWMQKNNAFFPLRRTLEKWVKSENAEEKYISFTDNFFWASLQNILDNPLCDTEPEFIKYFCKQLLNHSDLGYCKDSEVKIISNDVTEIKKEIAESSTYQRLESDTSAVALFSLRKMSKQIPQKKFDEILQNLVELGNEKPKHEDSAKEEDIPILQARRLIECICVKDGGKIHLLCDDSRSLMRTLYNEKLVLLRAYHYNIEKT